MADRRRAGGGWRRVLIVVAALLVVAALGLWVAYVSGVGREPEPQPAGTPVTVKEGQAFRLGAFQVESGWRVRATTVGLVVEDALWVTNTWDDGAFPSMDFTFVDGDETKATITCSGGPVKPGQRMRISCLPGEHVPRHFDKIIVIDRYADDY